MWMKRVPCPRLDSNLGRPAMQPDSFQVTPEHIAMLDEIGMQWDAREAKWQCALRRAGEYRAARGSDRTRQL